MIRIAPVVFALLAIAGLSAAATPVELLKPITAEKYPDANAVVVFDSTVVALSADGRNVTREHRLIKILTEEGKKAYATSFDSYCLTWSKLEIRLARVITPQGRVVNVPKRDILDVPMPLWEGSKFVLPNVRVKSIQFPGLELGSSVEWISEDVTHNPPMEGQFDVEVLFENYDPIVATSYTIDAPTAMKFRWLVKSGSVDTSFSTRGKRQRMTWSAHDVPKVVYEPMMPYVESMTRLLVCTQPDWQTWSRWYYDLCSTQYEVDTALARAIDSLTAGAATEDAKVRALYNFVDQRIRYVETSYSGKKAGYQPEKISLTYQKRYGVCRDKAALLTGMLRHVGIDAYITLTNGGSQTDGELPVDQFNHATVAVKRADGSIYYLDPTVENSRQYLVGSEMNRGVLVATKDGDVLRYTPLLPSDSNLLEVRITDTLAADGSLSGAAVLTPVGQQEFRLRSLTQYLPPEQQKQAFERYLRVFGPAARLDTITMTDPRDLNEPLVVKFHFTVRDFATLLKSKLANRKSTIRFTLPKAGNGMFPSNSFSWASSMPVRKYAVDFHSTQAWHMFHEMALPKGYKAVLVPDPLVQSSGRVSATSETRVAGNRLVNEARFSLNDPVVPVAEYQGLRNLLAATEEIERQHVMLKAEE
jgi:transglutaminase-like putative cysteine protease